MKFVLFDLMGNHPNPVTGELFTAHERIQQVKDLAVLAESLGFDGFGVGERHGAPFLSSSPAVMLTAIAEKNSKIRLLPTVSVLSVLDPVRVAEDYATVDHLSEGRLEMMIGKGNDQRHYGLFGITEEEQWDSLAERYELLKRLWNEENVTWNGKYRAPVHHLTTEPRTFQTKIPIWHGSASSPLSTELAAKNGDPIFSSNSFHPMEKYKELIDHYRNRLEYYGYNPEKAVVGAGARGVYISDTAEEAVRRYRPYYEMFMDTEAAKFNQSPFRDLEDLIKNGSALVGSADQVVEKILKYHKAFGHQVQSISVEGLGQTEQQEQLERFAKEVIPVLRREIPSAVWESKQSALKEAYPQ